MDLNTSAMEYIARFHSGMRRYPRVISKTLEEITLLVVCSRKGS